MIQGRQQLRFAAEACKTLGVAGDGGQEHLDRDVAVQLRIAHPIHFAHAASAEGGQDLVGAEARAGRQSQWWQVRLMLAEMSSKTRITPDMSPSVDRFVNDAPSLVGSRRERTALSSPDRKSVG